MVAGFKETKKPLVFEKELLPVGDIVHWVSDDKEVKEIRVKRTFLDKVVDNFKKMKEVGVRCPLFGSHVESSDNHRGEVVAVKVKKNNRGEDALFGRIKFNNAKVAEQGKNLDVSVGIPPKFVDGKKNVYEWPLRHVALTAKPIVPGMQRFEPILLSFDTPTGLMLAAEAPPMNELIDQILAALQLTAPDGSDEAAKLRLILQKVQPAPSEEEKGAPDLNLSFSPLLTKELIRSREQQVDGLIRDLVLTPARGAEWKKKYCTKDAVEADIKLSHDNEDATTAFDAAVEQAREFAEDRPISNSGREGIRLSHKQKDDENPLIKAAKKKAEAAKK